MAQVCKKVDRLLLGLGRLIEEQFLSLARHGAGMEALQAPGDGAVKFQWL